MDNICRICRIEENNLFSLLSSSPKKKDKNKSDLLKAYTILTGIQVSVQDNIPHGVCGKCIERLIEAFKLYNEATKSYFYFLENKHYETTNGICNEEECNESYIQDDESALSVNVIVKNEDDETDNEDENEIKEEFEVIFEKSDDTEDEHFDESEIDAETNAVDFLTSKSLKNFMQNQSNISSQTGKERKSYSTDDKKYQCQICQKRFLRKSNLVDHLRLHAKIKPFQCEFCDKAFVQIGNYKSHLRTHTKERPYACHICKKSYSQSSALKVHIRSHTNERNYCCNICGKAFTNSSDLGKHKRLHDPDLQYKCPHCYRLFAQKCNLKSHIEKKHNRNRT